MSSSQLNAFNVLPLSSFRRFALPVSSCQTMTCSDLRVRFDRLRPAWAAAVRLLLFGDSLALADQFSGKGTGTGTGTS
ncbi:MAG: hypothetical protein ACE366_03615 [Bradymonadia bacterium]